MPCYLYVCPTGHETELLRPRTVEVVSCACGQAASRSQVNRIGVSGFADVPRDQKNYRQSYKEYAEAVQEVGYAHDKAKQAGSPGAPSDLFSAAMRQAKARGFNAR